MITARQLTEPRRGHGDEGHSLVCKRQRSFHPPDRRVRLPYSRRCPTAHTFDGVGPVAEAVGAPVTPIMSAYPHKTPIGTPMALTPIHGTDEMRNWLNQVELELGDQPLHLRLDTVSGRSRPEVPALLESLQSFSGHDVNVEIVCWSEPGNG